MHWAESFFGYPIELCNPLRAVQRCIVVLLALDFWIESFHVFFERDAPYV